MITVVIVVAVVLIIAACARAALRLLDWLIDHGDPFAEGLTVNAAADPGIDMTMPPEIAHDEYPRVAVLRGELTAELASTFLTAPLAAEPQSSPACRFCVDTDAGLICQGVLGGRCPDNSQSSPAAPPPPPGGADPYPGTAAAAPKTPVKAPPLPRLLPPAAAAIGALRVLTAPHRAAQARAWEAEVMSVFPPDRPWPSDDTLTRMHAIRDGAA